jgi:Transcriptional Coactivator p15 (PC4)
VYQALALAWSFQRVSKKCPAIEPGKENHMDAFAQCEVQGNILSQASQSNSFQIAQWQANKRDLLRISIDNYKGTLVLNIRLWFTKDGKLLPSGKGIAVNLRHLPRFSETVTEALAIARANDLIPSESGDDDSARGQFPVKPSSAS